MLKFPIREAGWKSSRSVLIKQFNIITKLKKTNGSTQNLTLAIDDQKQLKKEGDSKNAKTSGGFLLVHNFLCIYALKID